MRDLLEQRQIVLYFFAVLLGAAAALVMVGTASWDVVINPVLGLMLFVTFLQIPLTGLGQAFRRVRFLAALLVTNFVAVPALVALLLPFAPADGMIRLGILMVLLCPCIDWVVTFAQMGRADAALLLASTPVLLVVQMVMLPLWLRLFLDDGVSRLVQVGPFLHAFLWLIVIPLCLAWFVQFGAQRSSVVEWGASVLGLLPVPVTALVLFIVIAAMLPQLVHETSIALHVVPIYAAFAVFAPFLGWGISKLFRLEAPAGRALAFSGATRNSLVVLPLALAVSGAAPLLPAVIVTQTLVELASALLFIRVMPRLGASRS
ncbi:arsenic resistance protein [Gluconobacter sphaericus NBRC 12467]|uniref:Arsenic resistance protein n=2 Tax=Gluconobacter sphaericus TaxID=574987 RepID=A0AA37SF75_9PROT|nr:efflux protein [Gluconobacter sphaericus NBRC 12467]GEB41839.1 arsenic resistance protein [Gluconobacter sphaericus NBRC 12467]GLQ84205.1 arsenic resistance protein [Gluconobacter sphaericus NBRC 12467]